MPGSGTRDLGLKLLELNQMDVKSEKPTIKLKEFTASQSLKALNANELDAVMLVSGPQASNYFGISAQPKFGCDEF